MNNKKKVIIISISTLLFMGIIGIIIYSSITNRKSENIDVALDKTESISTANIDTEESTQKNIATESNTEKPENTTKTGNTTTKNTELTTETPTTRKTTENTTENSTTKKPTNTKKSTESTTEKTTKSEKTTEVTETWDNGKITKKATCTENGVKTYTSNLGNTKTEVIPATGHSWGNSYKTIIETHDTVLGWETHYMSNGLDLTELYGITSDAACQEFIINHADSYGGYSTKHISYVVEKAYVINAINHQCTNCGIEETLSTEKEYIE